MKTKQVVITLCCISFCLSWLASGCESSAKTNALIGTGVGALIGQAAGGDTGATLVGAGVGAGVGYLIGNSQDKKAAEKYDYNAPTSLSGTQWMVSELTMEDKPQYQSITVQFTPDGKLITTRINPNGTRTIQEEKYRIVGQALIIHKSDYIINAEYALYGNEMVVTAEDFKAVLKKI